MWDFYLKNENAVRFASTLSPMLFSPVKMQLVDAPFSPASFSLLPRMMR